MTEPLAPIEPVGDAACWLDRVCESCGALNEGPDYAPCWRCSTERDADD